MLNLQEALRSLPHGPEFRFIDRITELTPGRNGVAEYTVKHDQEFLRGHLPGAPLLPGVLLVEAGAQLAGAVAQSDPEKAVIPNLRLAGIQSVRFHGSVVPGETIRVTANIAGRLGSVIQAEVKAYAGETLLMSGSVALAGSSG